MARRRCEDESGNLTRQIVQRSRQEAGVKKTYLVLLDPTVTEQHWMDWALGRKAHRMGQVLPFPKAERKHKVPVPRQ
jgi:hypothetical protein